MPQFAFAKLKDELAQYLTAEQIADIEQAFQFAAEAHEGQKRHSGEPYVTHPIAVANILAEMRMDHDCIIAAILHDVIEDTEIDKAKIASLFGDKVADIVDGVSKLKKIKYESKIQAEAFNLRKMMLAMSRDIRVVIVKLADRLHNMRTIGAIPRYKQRQKALETLQLYAPIAHRLGMNNFKVEYEDLGFQALYPMRYRILKAAVKKMLGNRKEIMSTIHNSIEQHFAAENLEPLQLFGREKHLYSIYSKMCDKKLSFAEVNDVYAFRIVMRTVPECYMALGIVHSIYKPVPGKFKDYIAMPKPNGYQSLHTVMQGPFGVPIEVQIRTEEMHRMAEKGIAAHFLYKSPDEETDAHIRAREWLKGLLEIQQDAGSSREFIENVKLDLYPDDIYVFTPKGKILTLPAGATPIDFAYAIHSDIGDTCVAAKIDRRLAPLSTPLTNGQAIEIITANGAHPSPAWLSFVKTGKARSNIRNWLKSQHDDQARTFGQRLLERALGARSYSLNDISEQKIADYLASIKLGSLKELFIDIGLGNHLAELVAHNLITDTDEDSFSVGNVSPLVIKGTEGMVVTYSACCYPIPDDPIVGFLSAGRGITIHHEQCSNIEDLKSKSDKLIHVHWADQVEGEYRSNMIIDVENERGVLAKLASTISDADANIINVQIDERDGRENTLHVTVAVHDRKHLAKVMRHLRHVDCVIRIVRSL